MSPHFDTPEGFPIATYGRVSDLERQGNNFSIPTQLEKMRERATTESWHVVAELQDKESAWRDGLDRSELNRGLELARAGKIKGLMFFSSDRFTRDMADGVILRRELKRLEVRLFCYSPALIEVTSDMEIMHIITDYGNQQFVEKLREASMRGVRGKVNMGLFPQGTPPFGYKLVGRGKETQLLIDDEEGRIIHDIYHWYYYYDVGCTEIADRLNERAIKPNKYGRGCGKWNNKRIIKVLGNESYAGTWYAYRWKQVSKTRFIQRPREEWIPITIPEIIDRTLWEAVQEKLTSRHAGRTADNHYLMSCRLKHSCGLSMGGKPTRNRKGKGGKLYLYYRCNSATISRGRCGIDYFWSAPAVDETVWHFAYELINNPEKIIEAYRAVQEEKKEECTTTANQITALAERITDLTEQLESIIEQRTITKSLAVQIALDNRKEELGKTIDELTTRLDRLQAEASGDEFGEEHIDAVLNELAELRKVYQALETINEEADFSAKRALIDLLNLRATLRTDANGDKWVDIHWIRKVHSRPMVSLKDGRQKLHEYGHQREISTISMPSGSA